MEAKRNIRSLTRLVIVLISTIILLLSSIPGLSQAEDLSRLPYTIQPADTLRDLSLFFAIRDYDLIAFNNVDTNLNMAGAGRQIDIPVRFAVVPASGLFVYTVQRGDTLYRIANRFGVPMTSLAIANGIRNVDAIKVGQEIAIDTELLNDIASGDAATLVPGSSLWDGVPTPTVAQGKQIVVIPAQQMVYAFEDGRPVQFFVVSTGLPQTPTIYGEFRVYRKLVTRHMVGPGYDLPDVPWVLYFYQGYALHGTYWHENFGQPMSHGCVNMKTDEAKWLYDWAPIGTSVLVR